MEKLHGLRRGQADSLRRNQNRRKFDGPDAKQYPSIFTVVNHLCSHGRPSNRWTRAQVALGRKFFMVLLFRFRLTSHCVSQWRLTRAFARLAPQLRFPRPLCRRFEGAARAAGRQTALACVCRCAVARADCWTGLVRRRFEASKSAEVN